MGAYGSLEKGAPHILPIHHGIIGKINFGKININLVGEKFSLGHTLEFCLFLPPWKTHTYARLVPHKLDANCARRMPRENAPGNRISLNDSGKSFNKVPDCSILANCVPFMWCRWGKHERKKSGLVGAILHTWNGSTDKHFKQENNNFSFASQ